MIRLVKWETEDKEIQGNRLVLFNRFSISKGQWDGFMFDLQGLGFSKSEKLLGLKKSNNITLYFLKWYISYDKEGYKDSLRLVNITKDFKLFF
ncbi:hypothetical protein DTX80_17790 [Bacilli bacterium]|nr:hypothetical protein WH51_11415 [Bacilli bacterium VT-13-104]PZD83178.1 hypothetical protein DEJ64_16030 [Bacilli bacterium]PZD84290.1 hypothetical protein DEJ60_15050 [Bacilli bacterium]PZD86320.1 hypothetical protein DEJ66_15785 [Bacilli bacterium]RCO04302.1 hypothetical protein DTX80_17790 [Bacilli bacterium]